MRYTRLFAICGSAAALLVGAACSTDLNITNPNQPDVGRVLATPGDVVQVAYSSLNTWYRGATSVYPNVMMSVTSDVLTMNFGNFGARFNNLEPRIPYNNSSAASDGEVAATPWDNYYGALGAANDALRAFSTGLALPGNPQGTEAAKHIAMFTQAAALSNLALTFDSAFVVDEDTLKSGKAPSLQPASRVAAAAVAKWDALIAATAGKSHSYGADVIPVVGGFNSTRLNRLANTYAALVLAYTPRTSAGAATVDWNKVATYAAKGIGTGTAGTPFDFTVIGDNDRWLSNYLRYANYPAWMRIDIRVLNMVDPTQPAKYAGTVPPKATGDNRVNTDIRYMGSATERAEIGAFTRDTVIGDPARGIYMMSPYHHKRYEYYAWHSSTVGVGAAPYILAAESDLVRAEALIRGTAPDLVTAATLINNTRVTRGGRTPATAADGAATLLEYIRYERNLELIATNGWDMPRNRQAAAGQIGALQAGTARHLPIPARELEVLRKPVYTYGSAGKEM
ncbi:MAG TPA: RagB/SusD family nutrient uptake outer membrane protein [Gemmatimonadaceae bacterium]|nr:RagB/SusD family nutrient uptake outer membrane protein [Gemmatimonadaceae bacterium]